MYSFLQYYVVFLTSSSILCLHSRFNTVDRRGFIKLLLRKVSPSRSLCKMKVSGVFPVCDRACKRRGPIPSYPQACFTAGQLFSRPCLFGGTRSRPQKIIKYIRSTTTILPRHLGTITRRVSTLERHSDVTTKPERLMQQLLGDSCRALRKLASHPISSEQKFDTRPFLRKTFAAPPYICVHRTCEKVQIRCLPLQRPATAQVTPREDILLH